MASLGSCENIDRAANHPCQGYDGYGGLHDLEHFDFLDLVLAR
jgi:hypothetical protein